MSDTSPSRPLNAQIWDRADDDWYVEPEWCSQRLFEEEYFEGKFKPVSIYDPCCGTGRIVKNARAAGYRGSGNDLVNRGFEWTGPRDFVKEIEEVSALGKISPVYDNIVTNPPFDIVAKVVTCALMLAHHKVAVIFPTARLNAAHWITCAPLQNVWLMTPRPSMPPGRVVQSGGKVGGGKTDFCWLVFSKKYMFEPELHWLHRDK